jgi:hypothetical protein
METPLYELIIICMMGAIIIYGIIELCKLLLKRK